jgi:Protein of unknown function (DUF2914)
VNKLVAVRWLSVVVLGALAVGCGNRPDRGSNAPVACVPSSAVTTPASASVAAAPAATLAAPVSATAKSVTASAGEKPAAKPAKAKASDAPLKVKRLALATSVDRSKRAPVGESASFKVSDIEKLYAFVEVENPDQEESEVFVTFEPEDAGASQGQVALKVGSAARWRTWAFTRNAKRPGKWAAIVRSSDGTVLARTPFEVTL